VVRVVQKFAVVCVCRKMRHESAQLLSMQRWYWYWWLWTTNNVLRTRIMHHATCNASMHAFKHSHTQQSKVKKVNPQTERKQNKNGVNFPIILKAHRSASAGQNNSASTGFFFVFDINYLGR